MIKDEAATKLIAAKIRREALEAILSMVNGNIQTDPARVSLAWDVIRDAEYFADVLAENPAE